MGIVAVQVKIMPESPDVSMKNLKKKAEETIIKLGGKLNNVKEEPIAFGLNALIITMAWPEEKETGIIESELEKLEGTSSAKIIDYRRAFG